MLFITDGIASESDYMSYARLMRLVRPLKGELARLAHRKLSRSMLHNRGTVVEVNEATYTCKHSVHIFINMVYLKRPEPQGANPTDKTK